MTVAKPVARIATPKLKGSEIAQPFLLTFNRAYCFQYNKEH
jgi:hypothetical protein